MSNLSTANKLILAGAMLIAAAIGGTMGYENYHTVGTAILFGAVSAAAVFFGTLRAIG